MEQRLNKKLLNLNKDGLYPFHMPGHKRNTSKFNETGTTEDSGDSFGFRLSEMYKIDITEIDGFDNLHDPEGVIREAEKRASELFNSQETHFLVNGSTSGILAAISAVSERGNKIIVARNSHISAYNAILINELNPVYVYPKIVCKNAIKSGISGSISVKEIEKAIINNPDACAVFITSPTYDGILSDVAQIARVAHEYNIPLIVDEAHGALFYIEGRSAITEGADIVINSVHKTLPALTQTALLHINGSIVDKLKVRKYLKIYQTSSPSYILMGSIDYAVEIMEQKGNSLYIDYCVRTSSLKNKLLKLRNLKYIDKESLLLEEVFDFDESKVLISTSDTYLSGKDLYNILRKKYSIQPEMAAGDYVLLMTTLFDTNEGINMLIDALYEIDLMLNNRESVMDCIDALGLHLYEEADKINDSKNLNRMREMTGSPFDMTVFAYPPGIPIIVAGEVVSADLISEIEEAVNNKLDVKWQI